MTHLRLCKKQKLSLLRSLCSKRKLCVIYGKWTECLWCTDPTTYETYKKNEKRGGEQKKLKPVR